MEEVHQKNHDLTINDIDKLINILLCYDTDKCNDDVMKKRLL